MGGVDGAGLFGGGFLGPQPGGVQGAQGATGSGVIPAVDSVNVAGTKLTTFDTSSLSDGALIWVITVGAYFRLKQNDTANPALPTDNLTVVNAFNKAGYQWLRIDMHNRQWEAQTTWFIDPQNAYGTSDDENDGRTSATALRSYSEHARRLHSASITASVLVTVRSSFNEGDEPVYNFRTSPLAAGTSPAVIFEGVQTVIYGPSSFSSVEFEVAVAAADDNEVVDATIPVSWTASGLLADAVLFQRTNGEVIYWWAAKDLGGAAPSATLRIGNCYTATGAVSNTLVPSDTYTASTIPTIGAVRFSEICDGDVLFRFLNHVDADNVAGVGRPIRYIHSWRNAFLLSVSSAINLGAQTNFLIVTRPTPGLSGVIRGDGSSSLSISTTDFSPNRLTLQGLGLFVTGKVTISSRLTVHDTTGAGVAMCVAAQGGRVVIYFNGCLGGKGNTQKIANVGEGAGAIRSAGEIQICCTGAPWVAGSTSDPAPIDINNTGYTVAQIPILGGGLGQTNLRGGVDFSPVPVVAANGGQDVLIGSTGPAGIVTPGAPAGWETFRNGSGQLCYRPFWI